MCRIACKKKPSGSRYFIGKTLGERTAFKFAEQNNLDLVSMIPVVVDGWFLISRQSQQRQDCLALIIGEMLTSHFLKRILYVHTDAVVNALIFQYENPDAKGRHFCSAVGASIDDVANLLASRYPELNVATDLAFRGDIITRRFYSSKIVKIWISAEVKLGRYVRRRDQVLP